MGHGQRVLFKYPQQDLQMGVPEVLNDTIVLLLELDFKLLRDSFEG